MSKPQRRFSKEEKLEIVKLSLEDNQSIKSLSARFNISKNSIYIWRQKYLKYEHNAFPGKGNKEMTDTEREIEKLKKELRESRLENEILKKAVSIFSKSDKRFMGL